MGSAPYLGGGFGHFYAYAPMKIEYCIDRYAMEVKRQLDVLDRHLAGNKYMCGDEYTIADIAIYPWYAAVVNNLAYNAAEFLQVHTYTNLVRWVKEIGEREAVAFPCGGRCGSDLRGRSDRAGVRGHLARGSIIRHCCLGAL